MFRTILRRYSSRFGRSLHLCQSSHDIDCYLFISFVDYEGQLTYLIKVKLGDSDRHSMELVYIKDKVNEIFNLLISAFG